jgi:hypothetical protein
MGQMCVIEVLTNPLIHLFEWIHGLHALQNELLQDLPFQGEF